MPAWDLRWDEPIIPGRPSPLIPGWPPPVAIGMDPRWALPPDEIEVPIPYRLLGLPTPPSEIEVANPPFLPPSLRLLQNSQMS